MFLQLKPKTFIFMDWVAFWQGQYGCSSPSNKELHGQLDLLWYDRFGSRYFVSSVFAIQNDIFARARKPTFKRDEFAKKLFFRSMTTTCQMSSLQMSTLTFVALWTRRSWTRRPRCHRNARASGSLPRSMPTLTSPVIFFNGLNPSSFCLFQFFLHDKLINLHDKLIFLIKVSFSLPSRCS